MTKQELAKLIYSEEELKNVDFTIPQEIADTLRSYGISVVSFMVMDYNDNKIFGAPTHLGERLLLNGTIKQKDNLIEGVDFPAYTKREAIKDVVRDAFHQIRMILSDKYRDKVLKEEKDILDYITEQRFVNKLESLR